MKRPLLSEDKTTPAVARAQAEFHASIVEQVRVAVERDPVVVVGMAQNPVVKRARAGLTAAGIPFTYVLKRVGGTRAARRASRVMVVKRAPVRVGGEKRLRSRPSTVEAAG